MSVGFVAALLLAALAAGRVCAAAEREGVRILPVRDARTHAMLRARAGSPDPVERVESALALGRIGDPADVPVLERLVGDPDARVRAEAVAALARSAPGRLDGAAGLAADPDARVRAAFFRAASGHPGGAAALYEKGLRDPDPDVAASAARAAPLPTAVEALRAAAYGGAPMHVRAAAWERLVDAGGAVRSEALRRALAEPGSEFSIRALRRLGETDGEFFDPVAERLVLTRGAELLAAVEAVGRARISAALPLVLERMPDYAALPRLAACRALLAFETPGVLAALEQRLVDDPDLEVARAAAAVLAEHSLDESTDALVRAARADRPAVREASLKALGARGDRGGIPAAAAALLDTEHEVRTAALDAFRLLDPRAAQPVLDRIRGMIRSPHAREAAAAIRLLGALGDDHEVPFMAQRLLRIRPESPSELREAAFEALIDLGRGDWIGRATEIATELVVPPPPGEPDWSHDYDHVRLAALRYLERFAEPAHAEPLLRAFDVAPPFALREALAGLITRWTGVPHEAGWTRSHRAYNVESLGPVDYIPGIEAPGIFPVAAGGGADRD